MRGLFLGLANGTTCLAFCAPVLVPFLMHEGASIRQNLGTLLQFLGGRLGGYLLFGLLAWAMGSLLVLGGGYQMLLTGVAYVGLAVLLLVGVLRRRGPRSAPWPSGARLKPTAGWPCALEQARATFGRWPAVLPAGMGFLAAVNICPPLLLAFTDAASTGTLLGSLLLFLTFFLGTSIYFIPLSLLGAFRRVAGLAHRGPVRGGDRGPVLLGVGYLLLRRRCTMTTTVQPQAARPGMAVWKAVLLILPIALLSSSQWLPAVLSGQAEPAQAVAFPVAYLAFFVVFVLMLTTGKTHRYRSVLFILFAVALPLDFIPWMIKTTGSMMLSEESIYSGGASFCPLTMPMVILPALLKRIVIFPGELLPPPRTAPSR